MVDFREEEVFKGIVDKIMDKLVDIREDKEETTINNILAVIITTSSSNLTTIINSSNHTTKIGAAEAECKVAGLKKDTKGTITTNSLADIRAEAVTGAPDDKMHLTHSQSHLIFAFVWSFVK